jgi:hypothetical protein
VVRFDVAVAMLDLDVVIAQVGRNLREMGSQQDQGDGAYIPIKRDCCIQYKNVRLSFQV